MAKKTTLKGFMTQVDDLKFSKWKKRSKRKDHGLKPGDGGLPDGGEGIGEAYQLKNMFYINKYIRNAVRAEDEEEFNPDAETDLEGADDLEGVDDLEGMDDSENEVEIEQPREEPEDPNKEGLLRRVPGAHLVFKRATENGDYQELWIYNTADMDSLDIRQDILSGTDIPPTSQKSEDGSQQAEMWVAGNATYLYITGLPQ